MKIIFTEQAWSEYIYWQEHDKKMLKKLNDLLKDIKRNSYYGIGKPEVLKDNLAGFYSRRINKVHRLVYKINSNNECEIIQCKGHY